MGYDILTLLLNGLKSSLALVVLLFATQQGIFNLALLFFNARTVLSKLQIGFLFGRSIYWFCLAYKGYTIKVRKVLLLSFFSKIEFRDVNVVCEYIDDLPKEISGNQPVSLRIPISSSKWKFLSKAMPFEVHLTNVTFTSPAVKFSTDLAVIKLEYNSNTNRVTLVAFFHSVKVGSFVSLSQLELSFQFHCHHDEIGLQLHKWTAGVNLGGLRVHLSAQEHALKLSRKKPSSERKLQRYKKILERLEVFTVQFENTHVFLRNGHKCFVSNASLHMDGSQKFGSLIENDNIHNLTIAVNSLQYSIVSGEQINVPVVNVLLKCDVIGLTEHDFNLQTLSGSCTVIIIDPRVELSICNLQDALLSINSEENDSNKSGQWKLPSIVLKIIISNSSFILTGNTGEYYHLVADFASAELNIKSLLPCRNEAVATTITCKLASTAKLERFAITYNLQSKVGLSKCQLIYFEKWHFICDRYGPTPDKITSILHDVQLNIDKLAVVDGLIKLTESFTSTKRKNSAGDSNGIASQLSYELVVENKGFSCTLSAKDYLTSSLQNFDSTMQRLRDGSYNIGLKINKSRLLLSKDSFHLALVGLRLSKSSATKQASDFNDILRIDSLEMNVIENILVFDIPQVKYEFDINSLWFWFYFKHSLIDRFNRQSTTAAGRSSKSSIPPFEVNVETVLSVLKLPQSMTLLLILSKIKYLSNTSSFSVEALDLLVKSVYTKENTVFVPIFKVTSARLATSERDGHQLITDSMTLKMEYHFRFYTIVDTISTTIKAYKQLRSAFNDINTFNTLNPKADPPTHVKRLCVSTKQLTVMVNEDLFEQELGLIFKLGVLEQRERLEKLTLFLNSQKLSNSQEFLDLQYARLYKNFSTSWIARYRVAKREFHGAESFAINNDILDYNFSTFSVDNDVNSLKISIDEVDLKLLPPSFPLEEFSKFLYKHGKGVPYDTRYSTNLPMGIDLKTKAFSVLLRDYSLPALFFPNTHVTGDIIFAEALASSKSWRPIFVPYTNMYDGGEKHMDSIFGSHIIRTLTPIKTFMDIKCTIDSNTPSQITWGKSLQPGYQSVMLWFDFLTKPPLDPSPKVGFWDKIRLLMHGRLEFHWLRNSSLHLNIKGSSDPYQIADVGAGMTFAWTGDAKLTINGSKSPDSFLQINSSKFQMGIRDFLSTNNFDKVIMNLFGKVTWKMGMLFESGDFKMVGFEPRSQFLKSHHEIELVHPDHIIDLSKHDSYNGFRTDFIHLSFGVYSEDDSHGKNSVHLAPETLSHFLAWWRLFNTYTSGPIRQGPLFPDLIQNGKKFGKSLFTVKYQLYLAPLEITHVHRHVDSQSDLEQDNNVAFTGLKANLASLKLDLHQKRIKRVTQNNILQISRPVWKFSMNLAELDFIDADIRVLFAVFDQEAVEEILAKTLGLSAEAHDDSKKHRGNHDFTHSSWFDKEDYIDLHQIQLVSEIPMKFSVIPFIYSPRITYFRNIEEQGLDLPFPFGDENVHDCFLGHTHPEATQRKLTEARESQLNEQISTIQASVDYLTEQLSEGGSLEGESLKRLQEEENSLHHLKRSLHLIHQMLKDLEISENANMQDPNTDIESSLAESEFVKSCLPKEGVELFRMNTIDSFIKLKQFGDLNNESSFDNRFVFHNVLIKIDKNIRDHLINYINSIATRRQYQFFITHKAIILLDELLKNRFQKTFIMEPELSPDSECSSMSNKELLEVFQDFIREVSEGFSAFDNYSIRLISPQVQITSHTEPSDAILIVSRDIELSIIDVHTTPEIKGESLSVNSLMETRYSFNFADSQFFILDKLDTRQWDHIVSHSNAYGIHDLEHSWPPWLPLEASYSSDFLTSSLFLHRNDMFITFTRPNPLFFNNKSKAVQGNESHFHVGFPKLYLTSTSEQYSSIFNIVEDLLSFASDKDKKIDKLTQVFLADEIKFNLGKLDAKVVESLQKKVRMLKYLDSYTRFHDPQTYRKCSQDILVEFQTTKLQLNLLMSAIKSNYDRLHLTGQSKRSNRLTWKIAADELIWELFDENKQSFVVFGLGASHFLRSETYYGSTSNKISISTLQCYNLQPKTVYKELLGPFESHSKFDPAKPFIDISWNMGVPIGGISNLLELNLDAQPIIFKMDFKTSEKLMSYLFPKYKPTQSDSNSVTRQSIDVSDGESLVLSRKLSALSNSTGNSIRSPITRRVILADWDMQSFTKALDRNNSNGDKKKHTRAPEYEMDEMVKRSGKYFNVAKISVHGLIMSVSYRGSRSVITNVDNLIVKVPTIQYTNKLWSSEELIASFKKDIIKVVLQHAGNIIGNKFVHHKNENKYEPLKQISNLIKPELQKIQRTTTASLPTLTRLSSKAPSKSQNSERSEHKESKRSTDNLEKINALPETYDVEEFYPNQRDV
ncbi:unnamed protein product [Kluyveromyces dobzhanskii CBS 2104]|uniref:WGS project CCBQ000000000 data, contig 00102 n=1 Tax=Kluyveromyces dobzhanskii CBS 2104 TaxID=1427455 RepID=A0A0A8L6V1_9SACH|nr:unnamed protein product [Kluyveromyces dobzhanskii CBS 2104]